MQIYETSIIELIYDKNFDKIYRFFYYKTLNKNSAEDLTSDTFLNFIDSINSGKRISDLESYLFGIAQITFTKFLQNKYKEALPLEDNINFETYIDEFLEEIDPEESAEEILLKLLPNIPQKQAEVLKLRLIEKKNLKQICEVLSKDMNYVKTTQKRAIKSIKQLIACTPELTNIANNDESNV